MKVASGLIELNSIFVLSDGSMPLDSSLDAKLDVADNPSWLAELNRGDASG